MAAKLVIDLKKASLQSKSGVRCSYKHHPENKGIDALLVVVEPGYRSIETANNIARMGKQLGVKFVAAIANKITDAAQTQTIESQMTVPLLAHIDYDAAIQEADLRGACVFESNAELVKRLHDAMRRLEEKLKL